MFGETYYWRVRATDGPDVSEWSATWSFRIVIRVTLDKPLEANNLKKTDVTLGWKAITGLTAYHVQIDSTGYWTMLNSGTADNILGVDMVNDTATWMVGAGGLILYYDGETIAGQESGTSDDLFGVSFVDIDNGWAVGEGGTIIHYDGTVWSEQASPVTTDLYAVCFVDANNGWAVGKSGKVVYYNGTEWSTQYTASKDLLSVSFSDASQGWASAKGGVIIGFNGTASTNGHVDQSSNHHHEAEPGDAAPAEKRFTVGSSLGEVYAIQGVPTKTEKDVWFYGNSKVYFAKGKVLRWDEKTDSPLRVDVISAFEKSNAGFFGKGSTKEEVLAAQGRPDRDAGSVWDYGLSRVYFEKDRVTGWHEAQYNPLRVIN